MPSTELAPPNVRWDLTDLFSGIEDPKITEAWIAVFERSACFEAYRGRVASLSPAELVAAIGELEAIVQEAAKPATYANLLFACDASSSEIGAFLQKQMERSSELNIKLMFFELELQAAPQSWIEGVLADPVSAPYRHYIQVNRAYSQHRLSEPEEIIMEELANTGARAFQRLFDEVTANHEYTLHLPGEEPREATEQEVLNLLRHANREVRQAAADSLTAGLKEMERTLVFTYNNLIQDKKVEDRLRRYPSPEHSRHLANELDKETVDIVVNMCRERGDLVARYYRVKKEILGLSELSHIDRYAPLFETEETVPFEDAKELILDAFGEFSSTLEQRAREFFDKNWIDAEPRQGKTGGAFCSYITPDTHPVVFMSYLNKMDNVGTLAHELGHGVHASLSRDQSYFNFHGTLPLAELASTFGEMLVFDKLVAGASEKDQLALYADKIETTFATVYRQAAMFRFEQRAHQIRREEGELSPERFGDIWHEEIQSMFGDSLTLGDQHRCWWSYVSHFMMVPFYVYAYSFGELLVLSLYQKAKQEGPAFADRYEALLRLGGSRSPFELMETVGVNMRDPNFWKGGFDAIESLIRRFEELWAATGGREGNH